MGQGYLRFFLAALVVMHHQTIYSFGGVAVNLFFVLSGYVIARAWDSRYSKLPAAPLVFLLSRMWRLYPLFIVTTLFAAYWHADQPTLRDLILLRTTASRLNGPAWSLDIETQFYFIAPLLLTFAFSNRVFAMYALIVTAAFCAAFYAIDGWQNTLLSFLMFFMIGIVAAKRSWRPSFAVTVGSLVATLVVVAASYLFEPTRYLFFSNMSAWLDTTRASIVVTVIAAPFAIGIAQNRSGYFDQFLGGLSYPLYLIHSPIINYVDWILPAAIALYVLEMPSEWLRKYVVYRALPKAFGSSFSAVTPSWPERSPVP